MEPGFDLWFIACDATGVGGILIGLLQIAVTNRWQQEISGLNLPLMMACTLGWLVLGIHELQMLARPLIVIYLFLEWPKMVGQARSLLIVAALMAALTFFFFPQPLPLLANALDQLAFFATFIGSIGMLRSVAGRSSLIRQCGKSMICQPPKWRYPILACGAAMFGLVLNIGVLSLLGTMVQKGNTLDAAHGYEAVRKVRQRSMGLAVIRGFALAPLISPMGITLALILASYPDLKWADVFPLTFMATLLLFLVGWGLDLVGRSRYWIGQLPSVAPMSLAPLFRFCLLVLGIILLAFGMSLLLVIRLPIAVMLSAPLSALLWMAWQRRRLGGGIGIGRAVIRMRRDAPTIFGSMRGEIAVMGAGGFIGHLLVNMIDMAPIVAWLAGTGLIGAPLAIAAFMFVVLAAQVGFNPIISVVLLSGFIPELATLGVQPAVIAVALMTGWSLAMISSPITASMMIMARILGISGKTLSYSWNGRFQLVVIPFMVVFLSLASWFLA